MEKTEPEGCTFPVQKRCLKTVSVLFQSCRLALEHLESHMKQDLILKCDSNQNMWLGYMLKVADPFYPFFFFFTIISASEEDQKIKEIEKS